ncbi:MAG: F0F1 ATP synthase subunit C [Alphaproteobacteria bacterium]|nr:F0F1 ATP synthase subunit C [Alphaproteobacteria bacterium]
MEIESAKLIAAALALLPMAGVGIGLGNMFSAYNNAIGRNPGAVDLLNKKFMLMFAFTEALGIFALLVSLMILFK